MTSMASGRFAPFSHAGPPRSLAEIASFPRCYGSEFTSQIMDLWAYQNGVKIDFSRPGKPTDNAYIETFNGTLRAECLDTHWFTTLAEAQQSIEAWRQEYNESRPHRALGDGRRTNSPMESRLAAIPLGNKQPKTRLRAGTKKPVRSIVNSLSLPLVQKTPVTSGK